MRKLIASIPAILAASVPLAWPGVVFAQAGASNFSSYMGQLAAVTGFASNPQAFTYARGSNAFVGGVATVGSTFATRSNGARAMSIGMQLTRSASASAALAIRLNPAIATAAMASYLIGIVYNVATSRWEYGPGGASHYYTPAYGSGQAATVSGACGLHAVNANALNDGFSRSCLSVENAGGVDSVGNFTNGSYTVRSCNMYGSCVNYPGNAATAQNPQGVPKIGVGGTPVLEETWRQIGEQPLPDAVANALPGTQPLEVMPEVVPTRHVIGNPVETPAGLKQPVEDTYGAPSPGCPLCVRIVPRWVPATDPVTGTTFDPSPSPEPVGGSAPQKDTCGMPDTPKCAIDETGTPTSATDVTIPDAPVARTDTALPWVWGFSLPQGACSSLHWEARPQWGITLNPCANSLVLFWRSALGWLFGALTALYCWRAVTSRTGS